jgi:hypothetical protein
VLNAYLDPGLRKVNFESHLLSHEDVRVPRLGEQRSEERRVGKRSWSNVSYEIGICLKGLMKNTQTVTVNNMTEIELGNFLNTGHRPYRLEQTC